MPHTLALAAGFARIAVVAGVGTRNYYRRLGYTLRGEGDFMLKDLAPEPARDGPRPPVWDARAVPAPRLAERGGDTTPEREGTNPVRKASGGREGGTEGGSARHRGSGSRSSDGEHRDGEAVSTPRGSAASPFAANLSPILGPDSPPRMRTVGPAAAKVPATPADDGLRSAGGRGPARPPTRDGLWTFLQWLAPRAWPLFVVVLLVPCLPAMFLSRLI
jgi:hypothetical protein